MEIVIENKTLKFSTKKIKLKNDPLKFQKIINLYREAYWEEFEGP